MLFVPNNIGHPAKTPRYQEDLLITRYQILVTALVKKYGSQRSAAKALPTDPRAIKFWLDGERIPGTHSIHKINAALDGDEWEDRQSRIDSYARQITESGRIVNWIKGGVSCLSQNNISR